jgi:hypothetical protein
VSKEQLVFMELLQYQSCDLMMLLNVLSEDENVVEVYTNHTFHHEILENVVHHLEGRGRVSESEKHHQQFEKAVIHTKHCFPLIACLHLHILIPPPHIELSEELHALKLIHQFRNEGEQVAILDCNGVQHTIVLYKTKGSIVHVTGLQTHAGMRVWVRQVWVQVVFEVPAQNPHPCDGFGGFLSVRQLWLVLVKVSSNSDQTLMIDYSP